MSRDQLDQIEENLKNDLEKRNYLSTYRNAAYFIYQFGIKLSADFETAKNLQITRFSKKKIRNYFLKDFMNSLSSNLK